MKKPYKNGILLAATSNSAFAIGTMVANIAEIMGGEVDIFLSFMMDLLKVS
ncbi:hypothetical protein [Campylobacter devanensis]|uniref:hypothetical protein n=1 Tax=Campylobacter devanensis TaxID=3161138 RepID=UPI0015D67E8A|nr:MULTISPECIES: hypothetical protein [unclassified Campylobacter]